MMVIRVCNHGQIVKQAYPEKEGKLIFKALRDMGFNPVSTIDQKNLKPYPKPKFKPIAIE